MKRALILFSMALLFVGTVQAQKAEKTKKKKKSKKSETMVLSSQEDSLSYAIGLDIANNFKKQGIAVNLDVMKQAMADVAEEKELLLDDEGSRGVIMAFQKEMQEKQAKEASMAAEENIKKGTDFLEANGKREGVITLPSGLQYEIIQEGTGASPSPTSKVTTHYRGTLIDGTVFDSSYDRGQPATFPVNGVIQAWQIILPMMKEGQKVKIYSPSELAYGSRGSQPKIGPNEVLIFDIELIKVD